MQCKLPGGPASSPRRSSTPCFLTGIVSFTLISPSSKRQLRTYLAFGATGSLDTRKREVAAFLGNVMQESGSLRYTNEIGKPNGYCDSSNKKCPCASGKHYYGRGPLQISWNYNYCQAGKDLHLNLLQNPDQVATNAVTAWKTAFWFWMSQPGAGNSCHVKMTQASPSFAATIRTINSMECGGGHSDAVNSRVQYYKKVCKVLGVDPGSNLYCLVSNRTTCESMWYVSIHG